MPLQDIFTRQIDALRLFMRVPDQPLGCVQVPADLKRMLLRVLSGLDDDARHPHIMIGADTKFHHDHQYFTDLCAVLEAEQEQHQAALASVGIQPLTFKPGHEQRPPGERFLSLISALAERMPSGVRSVVMILDPAEVTDAEGYLQTISWLTEHAPARRVKFLVIDNALAPRLGRLGELNERAKLQPFNFSPPDIEAQIRADLANPARLSPLERQQYPALLAGFAFANKDYDEALKLHESCLAAMADKTSLEAANALYNLGNTHLAKGDPAAAGESYASAVELCLDKKLDNLLALVLPNLGIALHRQGKADEAIQSFQLALALCRTQQQRVLEANVLDTMAKVYQAEKKYPDAERCLLEALALYDGITSEFFVDVRKAGREDLLAKLEQHYVLTKEPTKLAHLRGL